MGKYDHIPELLGSENYIGWSTKMQYALACKDLWCHINTILDPADLLGTPSMLPVPADPNNVTAAERTSMHEWPLNDMKAKDLVTRHLSPSDSADATNYVGQHAVLREHLHDTGAPLRDGDTIYSILIGLPQTAIWQQFKSMVEQRMHDENMVVTPTNPSTFTIDSCVSCITAEAARHPLRPPTQPLIPSWVFGDHDHDHCYGKGGRMEGQAPWMRNKKEKTEKETTAAAIAAVVASADLASLYTNVCFASIAEVADEVSCVVSLPFSTILDLGTTVTLVKDRRFFHMYSMEESVPVHTANHGVLETMGRGTCVGWLTIGKHHLHVRLSNCLHVLNTMLNLLSVSCMNAKGWDVNFRLNMTCELGYKGDLLGAIPATGKLYAIDLDFIPFTESPPTHSPTPEFTAFVKPPLMLDLWHARLGHLGRNAVTHLDKVAKGVMVDSKAPLSMLSCMIWESCRTCI
ncbi:hypothetical protein BDR03DRAFT_986822 [Suillus americanus]|nr:hypothetical protein BDR03DRAFT_986822 [Suillus americanus]